MSLRRAAGSVDLDPLRCYHQIHGLPPPDVAGDPGLADVVLRRGLPRFLELFDRFRLQSTLFVVGSDAVPGSVGRALLAEAAAAGHELGNHSHTHPYELARLPTAAIERELDDCDAVLRELHPKGQAPRGFRSPGYELSPALFSALEARGYSYDSSLFPCPPYYLAKLAVLGRMALTGRRSGSIVGTPWAQLGPTQPYRPDPARPWRRGGSRLVELPVAVTPRLRLPAIGGSLLLSERLRQLLLRGMRDQAFFNLELHGLDLMDAAGDGLPAALRARQPDLRVPLADKLAALSQVLSFLREHCAVVPLCEVAEIVQRQGGVGR
jgi:peptidoglycan/xylan/chitin deacetylase (PgdA/CDA1 family)